MKLSSFTLIATCFFAQVLAAEQKQDVERWVENCVKKMNITTEKLEQLEGKNSTPGDEQLVDCFTACLFEESGLMKSGKLEKAAIGEAVVKLYDEASSKGTNDLGDLMNKCYKAAEAEKDACKMAGAFSECLEAEFGENIKSTPADY